MGINLDYDIGEDVAYVDGERYLPERTARRTRVTVDERRTIGHDECGACGVTTTDELCRLLDEQGLEWREHEAPATDCIAFFDGNGWHDCWESVGGEVNVTFSLTPEQAIAATLGPKVCHMKETVYPFSDKDEYWMVCSECGFSIYMRRGWQPLRYCSHCGARVVEVDE